MKMRINKQCAEPWTDRVKEDAAEFKKTWTEYDVLWSIRSWTDDRDGALSYGEILKCELEAYDSGWSCGNITIFDVHMVVDCGNVIFRIRACMDMDTTIYGRHCKVDEYQIV